MMFKIFVSLFIFISQTWAQYLPECQTNIGKTPLSQSCLELLIQEAKGNNQRKDDFEKGHAYALENILIFKDHNGKSEAFAGDYAAIKDPISVVSDSAKGELAYLNDAGDIMVFSTRFFGNISPARIVKNKSLYGAKDFCFTESNIYVLNQKEGKIILLDRMANVQATEGRKRDQILKEFYTQEGVFHSMACSQNGERIYLLDQKGDLYLFSPELKEGLRKIKSKTGWDSLSVPKSL